MVSWKVKSHHGVVLIKRYGILGESLKTKVNLSFMLLDLFIPESERGQKTF